MLGLKLIHVNQKGICTINCRKLVWRVNALSFFPQIITMDKHIGDNCSSCSWLNWNDLAQMRKWCWLWSSHGPQWHIHNIPGIVYMYSMCVPWLSVRLALVYLFLLVLLKYRPIQNDGHFADNTLWWISGCQEMTDISFTIVIHRKNTSWKFLAMMLTFGKS